MGDNCSLLESLPLDDPKVSLITIFTSFSPFQSNKSPFSLSLSHWMIRDPCSVIVHKHSRFPMLIMVNVFTVCITCSYSAFLTFQRYPLSPNCSLMVFMVCLVMFACFKRHSTQRGVSLHIYISSTLYFLTFAFCFTRTKPAYGRQGQDWIVGPGYSFVVFSTNKTMETNQKP